MPRSRVALGGVFLQSRRPVTGISSIVSIAFDTAEMRRMNRALALIRFSNTFYHVVPKNILFPLNAAPPLPLPPPLPPI